MGSRDISRPSPCVGCTVLSGFNSSINPDGATHPGPTQATIAARVLVEVLLEGNPHIEKAAQRSREVRAGLADPFAWDLKPLVDACRKVGMDTQAGIAHHLNDLQKTTRRGGKWSQPTARRLLIRIDRLTEARNRAAHGVEDDRQTK